LAWGRCLGPWDRGGGQSGSGGKGDLLKSLLPEGLGQALKHGQPGLGRLTQAHLEFEGGLEGSLGLGAQPQAEGGEAQSPQAF